MSTPDPILIGCSGWMKSQQAYFAAFPLIEIQQTFYKPPQDRTAERWRATAPPGFTFTIKASQLITHEPSSLTYRRSGLTLSRAQWERFGSFRPTPEVRQAWQRTKEIARILHAAVILLQCPPQFTPTAEHVRHFEEFFQTNDREDFSLAWEPRGAWPPELVRRLCGQYGLAHAVDPFLQQPLEGDFQYFRLHGGKDYQYRYTDGDLLRLLPLLRSGKKTYCLFNNAAMWDNGLRMQALLDGG